MQQVTQVETGAFSVDQNFPLDTNLMFPSQNNDCRRTTISSPRPPASRPTGCLKKKGDVGSGAISDP